MSGSFGCIGRPLCHSYSPALHRLFGCEDYRLWELDDRELGAFLKSADFDGINVTAPFKQAVLPYLDELDPAAARIGAVNTVLRRGGRLIGHNTDLDGLIALLDHLTDGAGLDGMTALILGTGGTSRTAREAAARLGAAAVLTVSRSGREGALTYDEALSHSFPAGAPFLINTTPVGTFPDTDGMPLDPAALPSLTGIADAVYHPLRTRLVLAGRARGLAAEGGLRMLTVQAARAEELFSGRTIPASECERVYHALRAEKEAIVLIGMPGCGKTAVGRALARLTGRTLYDTDEEIEREAGCSVAELFSREGEAGFRAREKRLCADLARRDGCIIACGGGTVLDDDNLRHLRSVGRLYFLDRAPDELLPDESRPLARTREQLMDLNERRLPLYRAAADGILPVSGTPDDMATLIERRHALPC